MSAEGALHTSLGQRPRIRGCTLKIEGCKPAPSRPGGTRAASRCLSVLVQRKETLEEISKTLPAGLWIGLSAQKRTIQSDIYRCAYDGGNAVPERRHAAAVQSASGAAFRGSRHHSQIHRALWIDALHRNGLIRALPQAESEVAPQVGLEPTTLRLTAECSAIELLRSNTACRREPEPPPGIKTSKYRHPSQSDCSRGRLSAGAVCGKGDYLSCFGLTLVS